MRPKPKSSGIMTVVGLNNKSKNFPYRNEKSRDSDSGLVQQLPLSVTAAAEDLAPQVEGGGGGGEHDEKLLFQTEAAHSRGRVLDIIRVRQYFCSSFLYKWQVRWSTAVC